MIFWLIAKAICAPTSLLYKMCKIHCYERFPQNTNIISFMIFFRIIQNLHFPQIRTKMHVKHIQMVIYGREVNDNKRC